MVIFVGLSRSFPSFYTGKLLHVHESRPRASSAYQITKYYMQQLYRLSVGKAFAYTV